jgi:hypothetical protein
MKHVTNILTFIFITAANSGFGQNANNTFDYSEIARNATGEPILNSTIQVQIALHFGAKNSLASYIENHVVNTNDEGKFTVAVGEGTPVAGSYSNLHWGIEKSYIEVFVNGISISNKEVEKPRSFGKLNNPGIRGGAKTENRINSNVAAMDRDEIPLQKIEIGDKTLRPGRGVMFTGQSPNHTIQLQDRITISAGEGIEINGEYPNLVISLKKFSIGDEHLGGKVAYLDKSGLHGFVLYPEIFGPANWQTFEWGHNAANNIVADDFSVSGSPNSGIGDGYMNTKMIMKYDNPKLNIIDVGEVTSIPQVLVLEDDRWFLPSIGELEQIYLNRHKLGMSGAKFYWSSSVTIAPKAQIYKGYNDRYNGTSIDPSNNIDDPYNFLNRTIYEKLKLNSDKVNGIKCINFSNGKQVPILSVYAHYFVLIREF